MQTKLSTVMHKLLILVTMAALSESLASTDVETSFTKNEIVPDILNAAPKKIVNVTYPSGVSVNLGNELTPTQVKDKPNVSWEAEKDTYYTLIKVDPDAPSRENHTFGEVRHWLVMNILESSVESGEEIFEYRGSGAPKGTGLHRYIFLVFKQPNGRIQQNEPRTVRLSRKNRLMTKTLDFTKKYNLGEPEFGNFYEAQYDEWVDIISAQTTE